MGKVGKERVLHVETDFDTNRNIERAVKAAANVDYVILCLGEPPYAENFGNIDTLSLPGSQERLARRLAATGKPVILVLTEGRPRVISPFEGKMAAVILACLPGNEGGDAIADILFGDADPSGRLPLPIPDFRIPLVLTIRRTRRETSPAPAHNIHLAMGWDIPPSHTQI